MHHNFEFSFQNVLLRPVQEADLELLRQWRNAKDNTRYLRRIDHITADAQKTWFRNSLESEDMIMFSIVDKERGVLVGSAAIYDIDGVQAEIGRILIGDPQAHGRKIGRNAVIGLTEFAFKELRLTRLILHVYKDNIPACKIYRQAGYVTVTETADSEGKTELLMERLSDTTIPL